MVSDKFMVNSDAGRMAAARYAADNYAWHAGLDRHDTLRLNLLVEETLGMVKAMVDDFYGQLWFSGDDSACEIHLEATANMDSGRKQELLSVSSSGRNASAKGFMGMLGDVISGALHNIGRAVDTAYGEILGGPQVVAGAVQQRPHGLRLLRRVDGQRRLAGIELQGILHGQHVRHVVVVQMAEHHRVQILRRAFVHQAVQHTGATIDQYAGITAVAGQQIAGTGAARGRIGAVVAKYFENHMRTSFVNGR